MDANKIIDSLGGSSEVSRLCQVTVGAVSQWRIKGIPRARLQYLKVIRPDLFNEAFSTELPGNKTEKQEAI